MGKDGKGWKSKGKPPLRSEGERQHARAVTPSGEILNLRGKGSSSAGRFAALSLTRLCQGVVPLELAGSGAPVDSVDESGWSSSWSAGSTSPFGCPSLGCSGWTCGLPVPPRLAAAGDLDLSVSGGLGRTSPFCAAVRTILSLGGAFGGAGGSTAGSPIESAGTA